MFRYGGEEFTILPPGTIKKGTEITCHRVVNAFKNKPIRISKTDTINITISAGAFVYNCEKDSIEDWYELVKLAD